MKNIKLKLQLMEWCIAKAPQIAIDIDIVLYILKIIQGTA